MYQFQASRRTSRDRGLIRPIVTGGVLVGALLIAAGSVGIGLLRNPISVETVDRSPVPVLTELRDLADYHAAQARFEVVVDQERDVNLVPQFVAGERVQYVAVGSVDAVVDFRALAESAISVDETAMSVTITVPAPRLADPVVDPTQSYVMNRDRGLVDRLGGALVDNPTSEQELIVAAADKMRTAASSTDLAQRAEDNTTKMLTGMLGALGFEQVTVRFDENPIDLMLST